MTWSPRRAERDGYRRTAGAFETVLSDLRTLLEQDLKALEARLEQAGAPWTPGRVPVWIKEDE